MTAEETISRHEQVVELAKRRGFFFPTSEPYGGVAGFWTYGPTGAALKHKIEERWRERFAIEPGHQQIEAPTILSEPVFEASGHLEDFVDMIVECPACGHSHRADHLIEAAGDIEDAEALPPNEVSALFATYGVTCPRCGSPLADEPVDEFNLMFETSIGPGNGDPGYLRPETAQGIFVDFPRLAEYARNQLPFGVTQIGPAYRNEISPRRAIVRIRELTQAELELFVDPEEDEPPLAAVSDVELMLFPVSDQQAERGPKRVTTEEAAESGLIDEPWIAYYLAISQQWFFELGVDPDRFRYRQHLPDERAHYACDCWDAEVEAAGGWIELAGFADRGQFDLQTHADHTDERYTVFRQYDEPKTFERPTVDPDMAELGPRFGEQAPTVATALEELVEQDPDAFRTDGEISVTVDGEEVEIPLEVTGFSVETVTEAGEHIRPQVIEPSFGVDRLVYTLLEHNISEDVVDGEQRSYLSFDPTVAPRLVAIFPLMSTEDMSEVAQTIERELAQAGFDVAYDDAGNIGRRYRRQDEIGTPFCVTVDHQTLEDDTITLRERDSTEQIRMPRSELLERLEQLHKGAISFSAIAEDSEHVRREATD